MIRKAVAALLVLGICAQVYAVEMKWEKEKLLQNPKFTPAPERDVEGVKAGFLQGPEYKGKETRIFAYYGVPKHSGKVPGMVLVHGGLGTAFPEWVRLWNKRGYAAIAIDTTGHINADGKGKRERDSQGGPNGWGSFNQMNEPEYKALWSYQAPAQIMLANSFLRSLEGVDKDRIGITGISWGGYLTCMAAANDERFKIAIPIYGCGYLQESPRYADILDAKVKSFGKGDAAYKEKWISTCDPSNYLANAKMPFLWINGTNDFAFAMNSWQKSYKLPKGSRQITLIKNLPHSQKIASVREEAFAFADAHLKNAARKMCIVTGQGSDNSAAWAEFSADLTPTKAQLLYTTNNNPIWKERKWQQTEATVNKASRRVSAQIPAGTTAYFFNLYSPANLTTSSEHIALNTQAEAPAAGGSNGAKANIIDEDYEAMRPGQKPGGTTMALNSKFNVTDKFGKDSKHSVMIRDVKATSQHWLPMRSFWYKGDKTITEGKVEMSFDVMQDADKQGKFVVEVRDYNGGKFTSGPKVTFTDGGKVTIGNVAGLPVTPGEWCNFKFSFTLGDEEYTCTQTTKQESKTFTVKAKNFKKIVWLGLFAPDRKDATTYIDNLKLNIEK